MKTKTNTADILRHCSQQNVTSEAKKLTKQRHDRALVSLYIVSILTIIFIVIELVGGILANSLAIMSDAAHMICDLVTFLISIMAIKLSQKQTSSRYSFGFQRAEVLGALFSILLIWSLTGGLIYFAIMKIINRQYDVDSDIMMITAGFGIGFNIIIGIVLFFGRAEHSHFGMKHHHGPVTHEGPGIEHQMLHSHTNINIRAAIIHVLGDFIQSIGVLIAAVIIKFTNWYLADPLCTFLFSFLVMMTTYSVMRDVILILMECAPPYIKPEDIQNDLLKIPGVTGLHSFRFWSIKMDSLALSIHLNIDKTKADSFEIIKNAEDIIQNKYMIAFTTIQVKCPSQKS